MTAAPDEDVVDLLKRQHDHIRKLFALVGDAQVEAGRQTAFEELRRFLAVHETAEALVTHPRARIADDGNPVVDARLLEEDEAKQMLADLDGMSVHDPDFDRRLRELEVAVLAHAEAEEREEFPLLRADNDRPHLERMATAVRAVEAIAPTHPHPRVGSSMTMNLMTGPLASVLDRVRDTVRSALQER